MARSPALVVCGPLLPTMAPAVYLDDDVWSRERELVVARQWVVAGREADVPAVGDRLRVDIADESVLVVRGEDGGLRGHDNVSRHRGPN